MTIKGADWAGVDEDDDHRRRDFSLSFMRSEGGSFSILEREREHTHIRIDTHKTNGRTNG